MTTYKIHYTPQFETDLIDKGPFHIIVNYTLTDEDGVEHINYRKIHKVTRDGYYYDRSNLDAKSVVREDGLPVKSFELAEGKGIDEFEFYEEVKIVILKGNYYDAESSSTIKVSDIEEGGYKYTSIPFITLEESDEPNRYNKLKELGSITYSKVDLTSLEKRNNINTVLVSQEDYTKVKGIATKENSLKFESNITGIGNTDFADSIKNNQATMELSLTLIDVWDENGNIKTHRDNEKEKLVKMFENGELITVKSNITNDIGGYKKEGETLIKSPESIGMKDFIIDSIEFEQSSESANTYGCSLTLKKVKFVQSKEFFRPPYELLAGEIKGGKIDREKVKLEKSEKDGGGGKGKWNQFVDFMTKERDFLDPKHYYDKFF